MSNVARAVGRKTIHFSDHALDRWWEREQSVDGCGRSEAIRRLDAALSGTVEQRDAPTWVRVSQWHRALACGYLVAANGAFVVNRNKSGDYVAVTYLRAPAPAQPRARRRRQPVLARAAA